MPDNSAECVRVHGRDFKVVAKFAAGREADANAYMEANDGTGVIAEDNGFIYIASLSDKGTPVQHLTA